MAKLYVSSSFGKSLKKRSRQFKRVAKTVKNLKSLEGWESTIANHSRFASEIRLANARRKWIKTNTQGKTTLTADGKMVIQAGNSGINRIMSSTPFKSLKSLNNAVNKANKEMIQISKGNIKKSQLRRGLKRLEDDEMMSEGQIAQIKKTINKLDHLNDNEAADFISGYENTEDWYEKHKKQLRDASKRKARVIKQAESGKSINATTAKSLANDIKGISDSKFFSKFDVDEIENAASGGYTKASSLLKVDETDETIIQSILDDIIF